MPALVLAIRLPLSTLLLLAVSGRRPRLCPPTPTRCRSIGEVVSVLVSSFSEAAAKSVLDVILAVVTTTSVSVGGRRTRSVLILLFVLLPNADDFQIYKLCT